jgi:hypothetical protein
LTLTLDQHLILTRTCEDHNSLCDPRRVELTQDLDLLLDVVDLILGVLKIDHLDGDQTSRPAFDSVAQTDSVSYTLAYLY